MLLTRGQLVAAAPSGCVGAPVSNAIEQTVELDCGGCSSVTICGRDVLRQAEDTEVVVEARPEVMELEPPSTRASSTLQFGS